MKEGDKLPEFSLLDQNRNEFNSKSLLGKKSVIYFYPKDETKGCTAQACSFRDAFEDFKNADANVVGISSDSPESHEKFAKRYDLPFTLLSDEEKEVRKLFEVPTNLLGFIPGRVTYIFDEKGILKKIYNSQMKPESHVNEAMKVLEEM
ncbi:peroxiredoxin [Salibacter sp.]|uniref:peroxiredoxin n=1 Tax=Salibacter sp. TaxID=2010995 RepID=UPI00286FC1E0|nr:peroxiredoxin [Salibacter sp.]MDR9398606.1 peroxiredoxin [Salibacter sp.]MDR9488635.1 peroxiredoxin [Salibacter sp.]